MNDDDRRNVAVVVLSTAPDPETAAHLAHTLVEERLAACVSRRPGLVSVYRWNEGVEEADETLLIIKTHAGVAPALTRRLQELHPYDVPEILVLPVAAGLREYLDWVMAATADAPDAE